MYKMPKLTDAICKRLAEIYKDDHVIFFLDEIMTFGKQERLDWRTLELGLSLTILLAFSLVGLEKGTKQTVSNYQESEDSSECLHL